MYQKRYQRHILCLRIGIVFYILGMIVVYYYQHIPLHIITLFIGGLGFFMSFFHYLKIMKDIHKVITLTKLQYYSSIGAHIMWPVAFYSICAMIAGYRLYWLTVLLVTFLTLLNKPNMQLNELCVQLDNNL